MNMSHKFEIIAVVVMLALMGAFVDGLMADKRKRQERWEAYIAEHGCKVVKRYGRDVQYKCPDGEVIWINE